MLLLAILMPQIVFSLVIIIVLSLDFHCGKKTL